ncbi:MAG: T9SS type A sorting domain-containing protein [Candidatus Symbiothrix sp.]|jgi:hypothetical protein|nr:T9SS type A sorting domain-containing protein [Candidatus Symbiothrix sp.]
MKKIFLIVVMLSAFIYARSQTPSSYLEVSHFTGEGLPVVDSIAFDGGEIIILNDVVTVAFASDPSKNKTYAFGDVVSFKFETRTETAIPTVKEVLFSASIDKSGLLHIQSSRTIDQATVYSVAGILIKQTTSQSNTADIDLSNLPKGIYLVKVGDCTEKIIKH